MESWKLYIAQSSKTKRYYTGISPNPLKRIELHNSGQGAKFAIDQGPMKLVYISAPYNTKSEARKREIQVKGWRAEKKKWLIEGSINIVNASVAQW
ncbi:MAG: GIY-YIG nuclease family protein [Patescibacteria group bacterium]